MNTKYTRYASDWEDLDEDMKLVILEAVGLDSGYVHDSFGSFPKWAQDKIIELDKK